MPATSKNKKTGNKKALAIIDPKGSNYEKHPFFIKKADEAKAILKAVGLPKRVAK